MIINFSVQNFGCIKDKIELSFEATNSSELEDYYIVEPKKGLRILKLGLIYGANASGKTTILKALDFLKHIVLNPLDKKTETFDFNPFLFDETTPDENTFFSLGFVRNQVKYVYEIELNKWSIVEEKLYYYKPNKALVYKRTTDSKKQISTIQFGSKIKLSGYKQTALEVNTLWNNTVLGGYLKTNFEAAALQETIDWFSIELGNLIGSDSMTKLMTHVIDKLKKGQIDKSNLIKILSKADFNITDFQIKREEETEVEKVLKLLKTSGVTEKGELYGLEKVFNNEITFSHTPASHNKNSYSLEYFYESQGTQRYFQLAGLLDLMIRNKSILSIDEIEASLHPDLLEHFLLTFLTNTTNSQLIATTHYRELLMKRDIFRQDAIWFTEKKPDGSTDLFSLADFDSSVVRNTTSVYNAYKIGKLGAKPKLKDYYIEVSNGEEKKA